MNWWFRVFSTEIQKLLAYRSVFWIDFFLPVFAHVLIAFFLWSSIFLGLGVDEIKGFKLLDLVFYYFLVSTLEKINMGVGWKSGMSDEIYTGQVNRYLVYPVGVFAYKAASYYAHFFFNWAKTLVALVVFVGVLGLPEGSGFGAYSLGAGLVLTAISAGIQMMISLVIDCVAFWADNVWSLHVMFRFVNNLLGGAMVPFVFFGSPLGDNILPFLPFASLIHFPIEALRGNLPLQTLALRIVQGLVWWGFFRVILELVWRRGLRRYSGVGI